jgi:hypothetical protein
MLLPYPEDSNASTNSGVVEPAVAHTLECHNLLPPQRHTPSSFSAGAKRQASCMPAPHAVQQQTPLRHHARTWSCHDASASPRQDRHAINCHGASPVLRTPPHVGRCQHTPPPSAAITSTSSASGGSKPLGRTWPRDNTTRCRGCHLLPHQDNGIVSNLHKRTHALELHHASLPPART